MSDFTAKKMIQASHHVTIAFWAYGDPTLPQNTTGFSAANSGGGRVLQTHLPWGNSNIYWDAGNSYDRIDKAASAADFKGRWTHWAFTKNTATGTMEIYLDGQPWHSGTGCGARDRGG